MNGHKLSLSTCGYSYGTLTCPILLLRCPHLTPTVHSRDSSYSYTVPSSQSYGTFAGELDELDAAVESDPLLKNRFHKGADVAHEDEASEHH